MEDRPWIKNYHMLRNYFKIAWRTLMRHKLFSFINVFGLATGMAVCILALIDIRSGYQYDRFHPDADRIYRVNTILTVKNNATEPYASAPYLLGAELNNKYSFIEHSVRVNDNRTVFRSAEIISADVNFTANMGLGLQAGHYPDPKAANQVLINETAVKAFRFKNATEADSELIWLNDSTQARVAGVLKDFHSMSMHFPIIPTVIANNPANFSTLQIKVAKGTDQQEIVSRLNDGWKQLYPHQAFSAQWFNDMLYEHHMHNDDQFFMMMIIGITLSIACLGLLGMVIYTTEIRVKEIGIRKVMGAGVSRIVYLLAKDFFKLLVIAAAVAMPVGLIAGNLFLQNFAYHVSIGLGVVSFGFLVLLLTGGATVAIQSLKAALANPVKSLRNE